MANLQNASASPPIFLPKVRGKNCFADSWASIERASRIYFSWEKGHRFVVSKNDTGCTYLCRINVQSRWNRKNHLLGAAMILNEELSKFTSLTVYPEGNSHFKEVLPEYEMMLTDKGKATFKHLTYEKLFSLMEQSFNESAIPQLKDWIAYLQRRYIVD